MKQYQWLALANFHAYTLPQKMGILLARREVLFQQQQNLLEQQATLARQMHELIERQTAHELQSRLFWCKLRQATLSELRDDE